MIKTDMDQQPSDQSNLEIPLWHPAKPETSALWHFKTDVEKKYSRSFSSYAELHDWSIKNPKDFWSEVWEFCDAIASQTGQRVMAEAEAMRQRRFFPEARLNYAENLLRRRDAAPAIIFKGEDKVSRQLSFAELYDQVSRVAQALKNAGVEEGDRVAGWLPNMAETIVAMLATASIGATWSSASPDFGVQGVLDRFGQIAPKILFVADAYWYNGKAHDCLTRLKDIQKGLPELRQTIVIKYAHDASSLDGLSRAVFYDDFIKPFSSREIDFAQMPFDHPLFIMFSSGTTGVPKCIVHGAGGTLLQHLKEHRLHCDIRRDDKVFYFTTCGWMMWNWLVSALACEATLLLYDGAPFYPDGNALWDFAEEQGCTLFGTSAKYLDALKKEGYAPRKTHKLEKLRTLTSTGSPLTHEGFDFVYQDIKADIHLASISGGTDIVSCFVLGNPVSPVWRGEIQGPGLGMDIDVFDDAGKSLKNEQGELVCKSPFPCMPVSFWHDKDGEKYRVAYFEKFGGNVWCHGDWVEWTEHDGFIIYGRSDATLNPGGVRIGTAEIYRQVEQLPEIRESLAVGQDWEGDVRVILFVALSEGTELSGELQDKIKKTIREGTTPRHVPAKIVQVTDIPRTKSGKITELAVREIIHGRPVKNIEALANPQALDQYKNIAGLK